ncbi:MAG TPA: PTS IIA-like nitrogen regulatory protein PtsN [Pseudomonadales bacterium]|nr:PTS IIA-like nitrogen regulatory protein PtsN [Pseudomonadales bacterium]
MRLTNILKPYHTLCHSPGVSKKRCLETIANFVAHEAYGVSAEDVFMRLIQRERLGSTGIGNGIAIPHCRIPNLTQVVGALITLDKAIDFEAIDEQPVDLIFVLLVPEESFSEHLETLATLAELFNQDTFCDALRGASNNEQLYNAAVTFAEA